MKTIPFYDGRCGTRYIQYCDLFAPFYMASRIVYIYNSYRVPIWFNTVSDITLPVYKKQYMDLHYFCRGSSMDVLNFPRSVSL